VSGPSRDDNRPAQVGASSGTYNIQITGNTGTTLHATARTLTIQ
jgi:hypothetical protein